MLANFLPNTYLFVIKSRENKDEEYAFAAETKFEMNVCEI